MAKQQKLRVIFDTNWYVSASINRKSRRTLHALLTDQRLQMLYTDRLFEEFSEVIYRPKFEKTITYDQIQRFIRLIVPNLEHIKLKTPFLVSRDPASPQPSTRHAFRHPGFTNFHIAPE